MNLFKKQKQTHRLRKQTYGYHKGRRRRDKLDKLRVWDKRRVRLFATPWAIAYQAPLSMGYPRQEHWCVLLFPTPLTTV